MRKRVFSGKKLISGLLAAAMSFSLAAAAPEGSVAYAASDRQVLTVDLKETTGDILHGAAGFLYGISNEEIPTNNTMVPLKPKVLCTKGALGTEHPYGDALDVTKSFLESGGEQVMMYNSNYYGVFGVTANHKEYADVLKNVITPVLTRHGRRIMTQLKRVIQMQRLQAQTVQNITSSLRTSLIRMSEWTATSSTVPIMTVCRM